METPNPIEVAKDGASIAVSIARFVGHQLLGGGWAEFADHVKPANIQYVNTSEDNIIRGEE